MFEKKNPTNAYPRMGVCNLPDECTENESENKANWTLYTVIGRVSRPKYTEFLINGQRRVGTYVPGQCRNQLNHSIPNTERTREKKVFFLFNTSFQFNRAKTPMAFEFQMCMCNGKKVSECREKHTVCPTGRITWRPKGYRDVRHVDATAGGVFFPNRN